MSDKWAYLPDFGALFHFPLCEWDQGRARDLWRGRCSKFTRGHVELFEMTCNHNRNRMCAQNAQLWPFDTNLYHPVEQLGKQIESVSSGNGEPDSKSNFILGWERAPKRS